jgi:hypothetical protein
VPASALSAASAPSWAEYFHSAPPRRTPAPPWSKAPRFVSSFLTWVLSSSDDHCQFATVTRSAERPVTPSPPPSPQAHRRLVPPWHPTRPPGSGYSLLYDRRLSWRCPPPPFRWSGGQAESCQESSVSLASSRRRRSPLSEHCTRPTPLILEGCPPSPLQIRGSRHGCPEALSARRRSRPPAKQRALPPGPPAPRICTCPIPFSLLQFHVLFLPYLLLRRDAQSSGCTTRAPLTGPRHLHGGGTGIPSGCFCLHHRRHCQAQGGPFVIYMPLSAPLAPARARMGGLHSDCRCSTCSVQSERPAERPLRSTSAPAAQHRQQQKPPNEGRARRSPPSGIRACTTDTSSAAADTDSSHVPALHHGVTAPTGQGPNHSSTAQLPSCPDHPKAPPRPSISCKGPERPLPRPKAVSL